MSGSLIRILPFWTNTMRGLFVPVGRSGCSFYRVSPSHRGEEEGRSCLRSPRYRKLLRRLPS